MASNVNLNGVRVDQDTGRVSFSGIQSGIDTEAAINNIITARRIPIDFVERSITRNSEQIAGLNDYRALLNNLRNTLETLYGQPSLNGDGNVFESKQAFAGATRSDGGTASSAAALIGVTVDNSAELASQRFEVRQRATSMEIVTSTRQGAQLTSDTALNVGGTFKLRTDAGPALADVSEIVIETSDTLLDIRDKINFANTGEFASGVSAQVIGSSASASLVISADAAGERILYNNIVSSPTNVFRALDLTRQSGPANIGTGNQDDYVNISVEPQTAQIALVDVPDGEGGQFSISAGRTDPVISIAAGEQVSLTITDLSGGAGGEISAADPILLDDTVSSLEDVLAAIEASRAASTVPEPLGGVTNLPAGATFRALDDGTTVFFQLVANDDGTERIQAFSVNGTDFNSGDRKIINVNFNDVVGTSAASVESSLGFAFDPTIEERDTNQINDLFKGVTLDLLQAEQGTTIELDIENDLATVKQSIVDFVEAYNQVVQFQNLQRQTDPLTGEPIEEAVLANTSALSQTEALFSLIAAAPASGANLDFRALAQIGITTASIDNDNDDLLSGTLQIRDAGEIDSANPGLDNALLTNFDDVKALFVQQVSTNQSQLVVTSFTSDTNFTNLNGIQLNFDPRRVGSPAIVGPPPFPAGGDFPAAGGETALTYQLRNATGAPTGTAFDAVVDDGGRIIFTSGPAEGLQLFYSGDPDLPTTTPFTTPINITSSRGIGANFFYGLDRLIDEEFGIVNAEIDAREADNELKQTRVNDQLERLERERVRLTDQFNRMEAALAQLESLKQQVAAAFGESGSDS